MTCSHYEFISELVYVAKFMYTTVCLQVESVLRWQSYRSYSSVIIAARDGDINVHTNKAVPNAGIAYLALALRQRATAPLYDHHVPGCNGTGRSFLSVVSVYDDTVALVDRFTSTIGEPPVIIRHISLKVRIDAWCFIFALPLSILRPPDDSRGDFTFFHCPF